MKKQSDYGLKNLLNISCLFTLTLAYLLLTGSKAKGQTSRTFNDITITTSNTYTYNTITILPTTVIAPASGQSIVFQALPSGQASMNTSLATSSGMNYIRTFTPFKTGFVPNQATYSTSDVMQSIQYFDGLGRPLQTVQVRGSGSAAKDVVQPIAYDQYGREDKKYLPYAAASNDGNYRSDALTTGAGVFNFYNPENKASGQQQTGNSVVTVPNPYSQTSFEASPLNRLLEQGAPGSDWQIGNNHTVRLSYSTNDGTTYWAKQYGVTTDASGNPALSSTKNYDAGTLYVTVTADENYTGSGRENTTEEYKDKEGHVLLKRTFNYNTSSAVHEVLSTYYVYDDLGNLAFVLPPGSNADNAVPSSDQLNNLCYQYRYDQRNRLVEKKIPGKGWDFLIYNTLDQVSFTQDANQRNKFPQEWTFTRYDALGRVAITGIWQGQNTYPADASNTPSHDLKNWLQNWSTGHTPAWSTRDGTTITGYNQDDPPGTLLTVNYYDNYNGIPGLPSYSVPANAGSNVTGLLTASKTAVLNSDGTVSSNMLWAVHYYDAWGRNIATYAQHYLGGTANAANYDLITSVYNNITGDVTSTNRKHYTVAGGNNPALTIANVYAYDQMDRKVKTTEQINSGSTVTLSQLEYNDIGQLKTKHLGNDMQQVNYTYNERGWLSTSSAPSFAMQLNYNSGTNAQYNGNISSQQWGTPGSLGKTYTYNYDNLNRLTAGNSNEGYSESSISYDLMGNIKTLTRQTTAYTYNYIAGTNQLQSVSGLTPANYQYDVNGNMSFDGRNNVSIQYNMLNLPRSIPAKNLSYVYDAGGNKLRKIINNTPTEYISGIQYTGTNIDFVQTEEGRALNSGGGNYTYEYMLSDHLGNTRARLNQSNQVLQQDDYYPFGMEISRGTVSSPKYEYLYNKKELQEETGQYDYGARFYDPVVARFTTVDPLATKYPWYTPYQFAGNEVPNAIDRDGLEPAYPQGDGTYTLARDGQLQKPLSGQSAQKFNVAVKSNTEIGGGVFRGNNPVHDVVQFLGDIGEAVNTLIGANGNASAGDKIKAAATIISAIPIEGEGAGMGDAHLIPDNATVVRGGIATPEKIENSIGQHPSGPIGFSVECGTCSVKKLSEEVPHGKVGVTTAGQIREAGGDVIKTSGKSPNHATVTGLTPTKASELLNPPIKNPNKP